MADKKDINIDKNSVIPIYYQLSKIFEDMIYSGELKPGEKLPPENKIATYFEISRMTVRKALSELIDDDLLYSEKGKGTFVAQPKIDNVEFELQNFREEIKKRGMEPHPRLLKVKIIRANNDIAQKLHINKGTKCIDFSLVISADGEPLIYENKYIVYKKNKPILENELKDPSLSNLAMLHGNHYPIMSKRILNASKADKEEAEVLNIKKGSPVFVVEQILYDSDSNPVGWGRSICRGDKFKFTSFSGWSKKSNNKPGKRRF
ncbi:MAG TPA: GntR family transcriptional regulator [Halanaerobiales bacterium]|nr:GntR family transcriptional regulator [Halanaerobiales bacterium]